MDEPRLIERQLRRLAAVLWLRPLRRRRLLGEVRAHFEDALEEELARGTPRELAERLVVERFGPVETLDPRGASLGMIAAGLAACALLGGVGLVLLGDGERASVAPPIAEPRAAASSGELPSLVMPAPSDPPPAPAAVAEGVVAAADDRAVAAPSPPAQPVSDGLLGVLDPYESEGFRDLGNGRRLDLYGPATLVSIDPHDIDLSHAARLVVGRHGATQPVGLTRSPDGTTIAVTVGGTAVQFVDAATFRAGKTIALVDDGQAEDAGTAPGTAWSVWSVHWLASGLVAIHLQRLKLPPRGASPLRGGQVVIVDPASGVVVRRLPHAKGELARIVGAVGDELVGIRNERGRARAVVMIGVEGGVREIPVNTSARYTAQLDPAHRRLLLLSQILRVRQTTPVRVFEQTGRLVTVDLDTGGVSEQELQGDVEGSPPITFFPAPLWLLPSGELLLHGYGVALKVDPTSGTFARLDMGQAIRIVLAGETILGYGNFRAQATSRRCPDCGAGVTAYDLEGRKLWHALGVRKVHHVEVQGSYALAHVAFAHNKHPGYVVVLEIATGRALGRLDVPARPGRFSLLGTSRL